VDHKLIGSPSRLARCRFLEEVAADALRTPLYQPARGMHGQAGRSTKVLRGSNGLLRPVGAQEEDVAVANLVITLPEPLNRAFQVRRIDERHLLDGSEVEHDGRADDAIEAHPIYRFSPSMQ
jgi:hypothetical protein